MKKIFFTIIFLPLALSVQCQWNEDFSNENLTGWMGDIDCFNVASGILNLNAPAEAATKYLSKSSNISKNATWEFWVKLDFNPSGSSYCDIYLMANTSNLTGSLNGYYVRLGNSADNISLYNTNFSTAIISGFNGVLNKSNSTTRIKVSRDENNEWTLFADTLGTNNFAIIGTAVDNTFESCNYFGIKCKFAASYSTKFHFDDIMVTGDAVVDTICPQVVSVVPYFADTTFITNTLIVTFSEEINFSALSTSNFELNNGYGNPDLILQRSSNVVDLMFSQSININLDYNLTFSGIIDMSGNTMPTMQYPFKLSAANGYDVVISEIMAKPAIGVSLPNVKYVELYNRSSNDINLKDWSIRLNTNNPQKITVNDYILRPQNYVVLCKTDSIPLFSNISGISFIGVNSFPSLTTTSGTLTLKDNLGNVINSVIYSDAWYNDEFKKEDGGWSLEMIDLNNPCIGVGNWTASVDAMGGTPGKMNSVNGSNPDIIAPYPTIADVINATTLDVYFNEPLRKKFVENHNNFNVSELGGNPLTAVAMEPDFSKVRLTFSQAMQVNKVYYLNIIDSISDCCDNIVPINSSIIFGLADSVCNKDLIINEILFNPYSGSQDFVELYNRSDKLLDLKYLEICNRNDTSGNLTNKKEITKTSRLMLPQEYCVLTTKTDNLSVHYNILYAENLFKVASLPSMPNEKSTIVLLNKANVSPKIIIDEVSYTEKQHSQLLSSKKGVSLERICPNRPSNDITNWHSAAQDAGFATPGYQNSQYSCEIIVTSEIQITPETFSPDNDGYQDILNISYKLNEPGFTASMSIYNSAGYFVKELINNEMLGTEGNIIWDGFNENNEICPIGIYILYVEMFNTNGKKIVEKKAFVLSKKK